MTSQTYDVVIVGGGAVGSSIAYHLAAEPTFDGTVLVVERDPTYQKCSTALSWAGIRQQFSTPECIGMSGYGVEFYRNAATWLAVEDQVPDLGYVENGYLLLVDEAKGEQARANYDLQRSGWKKIRLPSGSLRSMSKVSALPHSVIVMKAGLIP